MKLVESVVWPVIEYSAPVWGSRECKWKAVMRQWCRFQNMDNSRLNKRIFLWTLGNSQTKSNWCTRVQRMFGKCSLHGECVTHFVPDTIRPTMDLAQKQNDQWVATVNWQQAVGGEGHKKLRLYREHKFEPVTEPYVKMVMPKAHRSALAKLDAACGVALLNIELGRYFGTRTPLERRVCLACSNDAIEDEVHVLIECPAYDVVRKYLMDSADTVPDFEILNSKEKLNVVMSRSNLQRSCARTSCDLLKHRVKFYCR